MSHLGMGPILFNQIHIILYVAERLRWNIKTNSKFSFLSILWLVIGTGFFLFQNNSEDLSSSAFHNELCAQAHQNNETKVYQLGQLQGDVFSQWPGEEPQFRQYFLPVSQSLQDLNLELYSACRTNNETELPDEVHKAALAELERLTDKELNGNWRNYLSAIESSIEKLKEVN